MKHCKSCENCYQDMVCNYVQGIDIKKCMIDHHRIDNPFWEGRYCEYYTRNFIKSKTEDVIENIVHFFRRKAG